MSQPSVLSGSTPTPPARPPGNGLSNKAQAIARRNSHARAQQRATICFGYELPPEGGAIPNPHAPSAGMAVGREGISDVKSAPDILKQLVDETVVLRVKYEQKKKVAVTKALRFQKGDEVDSAVETAKRSLGLVDKRSYLFHVPSSDIWLKSGRKIGTYLLESPTDVELTKKSAKPKKSNTIRVHVEDAEGGVNTEVVEYYTRTTLWGIVQQLSTKEVDCVDAFGLRLTGGSDYYLTDLSVPLASLDVRSNDLEFKLRDIGKVLNTRSRSNTGSETSTGPATSLAKTSSMTYDANGTVSNGAIARQTSYYGLHASESSTSLLAGAAGGGSGSGTTTLASTMPASISPRDSGVGGLGGAVAAAMNARRVPGGDSLSTSTKATRSLPARAKHPGGSGGPMPGGGGCATTMSSSSSTPTPTHSLAVTPPTNCVPSNFGASSPPKSFSTRSPIRSGSSSGGVGRGSPGGSPGGAGRGAPPGGAGRGGPPGGAARGVSPGGAARGVSPGGAGRGSGSRGGRGGRGGGGASTGRQRPASYAVGDSGTAPALGETPSRGSSFSDDPNHRTVRVRLTEAEVTKTVHLDLTLSVEATIVSLKGKFSMMSGDGYRLFKIADELTSSSANLLANDGSNPSAYDANRSTSRNKQRRLTKATQPVLLDPTASMSSYNLLTSDLLVLTNMGGVSATGGPRHSKKRQEKLKTRLATWLQTRASKQELSEKGILHAGAYPDAHMTEADEAAPPGARPRRTTVLIGDDSSDSDSSDDESKNVKRKGFMGRFLSSKKKAGTTSARGGRGTVSEQKPVIPLAYDVVQAMIAKLISMGGSTQEGIFRISGNARRVNVIWRSCGDAADGKKEAKESIDFTDAGPHDIASALKMYLRETPSSLVPTNLFQTFMETCDDEEEVDEVKIATACASLSAENVRCLEVLITFLKSVAEAKEQTLMGADNLGLVFGPTILRRPLQVAGNNTQFHTANQQGAIITSLITSSSIVKSAEPSAVFEAPTAEQKTNDAQKRRLSRMNSVGLLPRNLTPRSDDGSAPPSPVSGSPFGSPKDQSAAKSLAESLPPLPPPHAKDRPAAPARKTPANPGRPVPTPAAASAPSAVPAVVVSSVAARSPASSRIARADPAGGEEEVWMAVETPTASSVWKPSTEVDVKWTVDARVQTVWLYLHIGRDDGEGEETSRFIATLGEGVINNGVVKWNVPDNDGGRPWQNSSDYWIQILMLPRQSDDEVANEAAFYAYSDFFALDSGLYNYDAEEEEEEGVLSANAFEEPFTPGREQETPDDDDLDDDTRTPQRRGTDSSVSSNTLRKTSSSGSGSESARRRATTAHSQPHLPPPPPVSAGAAIKGVPQRDAPRVPSSSMDVMMSAAPPTSLFDDDGTAVAPAGIGKILTEVNRSLALATTASRRQASTHFLEHSITDVTFRRHVTTTMPREELFQLLSTFVEALADETAGK